MKTAMSIDLNHTFTHIEKGEKHTYSLRALKTDMRFNMFAYVKRRGF